MKRTKEVKPNYPVPRDKKMGCLGRDGTYSRKNCDDKDYFSQGVGNV